jgi:hypothetical protein
MTKVKMRWQVNEAVVCGWFVMLAWTVAPLYDIVKHWPRWNDGFILVCAGLFAGFIGTLAGCSLSPKGHETQK